MDVIIAGLIAWIVMHTGFASPDPPRVVLVSESTMLEKAFHSRKPRALRLRGLYVHDHSTIYLPETWNASNLRDVSDLLHELVHHVQRVNKVSVPCKAALERLAYDLQLRWLREQGVEDPYKIIDTNDLAIFLLSSCNLNRPDW